MTLSRAVTDVLREVRTHVEAFHRLHAGRFAGVAAGLRIVSPLAEGSDRLVAQAALDLGYELCCPMPFPQPEFEQDFAPGAAHEPESLEAFRSLLARAARETALVRFELDGDRSRPADAYMGCGRVVVDQSDLLVAIWDGKRRDATGGTEAAFDLARREGVPIVWIDARPPHGRQIVAAPAATLADTVRRALEPPPSAVDATTFDEYRAERLAASPADDRTEPLRRFHRCADALAVKYSTRYRRAFVLAYALSTAAVGMALLPLALGWDVAEPHIAEAAFIFAELAAIVTILAIVWRGRRGRWHERWMDYRLAAELVRQVRLLAPLGGLRSLPPTPAQWTGYGDPASTWMAWYVRAIERDAGLPTARLDVGTVRARLAAIAGTIAEQKAYHHGVVRRRHGLEARFHAAGVGLLALTLVACTAHLAISAAPAGWPAWSVGGLVFLAGFLPAASASLAGISHQGEYRRVAKRSAAMRARFEELEQAGAALRARIEHLPGAAVVPGIAADAADLAKRTAHLMVTEVLDWRVVFLDQPLKHT